MPKVSVCGNWMQGQWFFAIDDAGTVARFFIHSLEGLAKLTVRIGQVEVALAPFAVAGRRVRLEAAGYGVLVESVDVGNVTDDLSQSIGETHLADQLADLLGHLRTAASQLRLPAPIGPEAVPMPPDQSVWRNDRDCIEYGRVEAVEPLKQQPIPVRQVWPALGPAATHV